MKILRSGMVAAALLASLAAATTASASTSTCHGRPVTIKQAAGDQITNGTSRADVILLHHKGTVHAGAGADIICGSSASDVIDSGAGADIVLAGAGRDTINAGSGVDYVYGEGGSDRINGGAGRDFIMGGAGVDALARQSGDTIAGGTYAVSISLQPSDVDWFEENGQMIGLARTDDGLIPLAATTTPMMSTGFALGALGAYYSTITAQPYEVLQMGAVIEAPTGSVVNVTPSLDLDLTPDQAPSGSISIVNQSAMVLTTGVAQQISTGRGSAWQPILVSQFGTPPGAAQTFQEPMTVSVLPAQVDMPGQLFAELPSGAATSAVSPQDPTATFIWNPGNMRFEAGQPW